MNIYESAEDYLEEILVQENEHGYARSVNIAHSLSFSKPSVSVAMKNLRENGYINMDSELHHITLTEKGREIAERIYHRHQMLTQFLINLGVSKETAMSDACKIEHDISEESFQALLRHVEKGNPQ